MDGKTTIRYLQDYLKQKDFDPGRSMDYFLKLSEEVGELASAIRKRAKASGPEHIKGTIDEELWDVMYYTIALANLYDVDLEETIKAKEALNRIKYHSSVIFEENR